MIKIKELNEVICQKDHFEKIIKFATDNTEASSKISRVCSLNTLNSIVCNVVASQKKNRVNQKNDSFEEDVI